MSVKNKIINKEQCYVAQKDKFFAHGDSVKEAIEDLNFKIIAEQLQHDPIKKDTMIGIRYYHIVTGACVHGIKSWMSQHDMNKEKYKASELLPILEKTKAYGLERFKKLINWK